MYKKLIISICILLTGCSTLLRTPEGGVGPGQVYHPSKSAIEDKKEQLSLLKKSTICCNSIKSIPTELINELPFDQSVDVSSNSPSYNFNGNKSYFKAFVIGDNIQPNKLIIESEKSGFISTIGGIFYPVVTILNANFEVIKTTSLDTFKFVVNEEEVFQSPRLKATIKITNINAKYIIIRTTNKALEKNTMFMRTGSRYFRFPKTKQELDRRLQKTAQWLVVKQHLPEGTLSLEVN